MRWVLPLLAAVALATGLLLTYAEHTLFRPNAFADRAASTLDAPPVRREAARRLTGAVVAVRPDLTALQPLIELGAKSVVRTDAFRALVRRAALEAHHAAFDEERRAVSVEVRDAGVLIAEGLRRLRPQLARSIPTTVTARVVRIRDGVDGFMLRLTEIAETVRSVRPWAFVLAFVLAAAALALPGSRRAAVLRLGACGAAVAGTVALAATVLPSLLAGGDDRVMKAVLAVWLDPVRAWALAGLVAGVVIVLAAASVVRPVPVGRVLRRGRDVILTQPEHRLARWARLAAAIALGVAMIVSPIGVLRLSIGALGILLVVVAAAEVLAAAAGPAPRPGVPGLGRGLRVAAVALVITAGVAVAASRSGGDVASLPFLGRCNGHAALCDRRVDEVAFLTTHNAMSAAGEPGWFFAAQDAGIPQQLDDGVRGLMIDTHYGTETGGGVITEIDPSAASRAKLEEAVGEQFVATAERIRRRLVQGRVTADRQVFLCHTLCEVGATRALTALRQVHAFLVRHPGEVVVLVIQDETSAADTADVLRASGIVDEVYRGDARKPWPTLGELVERDQRVVVIAENQAGEEPWIHAQPDVAQETPFTFKSVAALEAPASCEPNRGGTTGSLFLVNHWVDTSPAPRVSIARQVNAKAFLDRRLASCRERRGMPPNLVAVDFYRQGDTADVVDGLNGVG